MSLTQINKAGLDEIALDHVFTVGASGSSAYTFQGEGLNGTVNNPTLYLTRGKTYRFENGTGAHPIRIQSTSGASGTAYNTGVSNNAGSGTVIVEVQHDAPDVLYYQCTSHAAMNGILYITGALADGGVTTAKLADDAVTDAKLANSINSAIAANTAKVQTTINNNADNRVITGSNSANTLNAESNVIIDSSGNVVVGATSANASDSCTLNADGEFKGAGYYFTNNIGSPMSSDGIRRATTGTMVFDTGSTERMRIDSSGRLLLGQTSGSSPLCVSGTNPVIAELHHSDGGTNDQARISLGALANNPPSNRGVNLIAENNGAGHDFVVACSASHSAGPGEKIRVKSSGGLTFNGDTAAANALDDYETGTWTPSVQAGGGSITHVYKATYTKIGKLVHIQCYVAYTAGSSTNAFRIGGLPFTVQSDGYSPQIVDFGTGGKKGAYSRTHTSNTYLEFLYSSESTSHDRITLKGNQIGSGYIILGTSYMV